MTVSRYSAVILAGGKSRRMGSCKALLEINGQTMLQRLCSQLTAFDELLISANESFMQTNHPARFVKDIFPACGPLAGIHAALSASSKQALLCVSCDLPNFTDTLALYLTKQFSFDTDALICQDSTGQLHPLCGIYHKRVLPVLEQSLISKQYKVMDFLQKVNLQTINLSGNFSDDVLLNMNTPDIYRKICG